MEHVMDQDLRDPTIRRRRLEEDRVHLFPLGECVETMRQENEYREHGHTGVALMKTRDLRVVLEVAEPRQGLARHVIHGPALVQVLDGAVAFETSDARFIARAGDMVVLPRGEPRVLTATKRSSFLLALAPDLGANPGAAAEA